MLKIYILENLGCANCAAKIERKISELPGVEEASITFATKQLRINGENVDALLPAIQAIATELEPDIVIRERGRRQESSAATQREQAHEHEHNGECCSEHDHNHAHGHEHDHGEQGHKHDGECCGEHDHSHTHGHDHGHREHEHENESECCGEHDHSHAHGAAGQHVPGHPDDCQCQFCHPHAEYCDVCGESLARCTCRMPDEDCVKRVYLLQNLGCANCAAKMEHKIRALPGVKYAVVSFVTKQLRLSAMDHEKILPQIQEICSEIEPDVKVLPRNETAAAGVQTKIYLLENLGCANCAAKMEARINALPGVTQATITYATKQLRLVAASPDALLDAMQQICTEIEAGVKIVERDGKSAGTDAAAPAAAKPAKLSEEKRSLLEICAGAILFILAQFIPGLPEASIVPLFILAYIILGGRIVLTALKNLTRGQVFDENFLMTIATLGAFAIQEFPEAVGVMLFYRIGEYFEHRAVAKSRGQIMDAVDLRPEVVNLLIGEEVQVKHAEEIQVGDILLVRPGDRIPLDGVVIEGESRIDTSPVTGEPVPVGVKFGDNVTSGCLNTSGALKIRVEKILEESMVTRILDAVENAAASKPQIERFITRFARIYTPIVVAAAIVTAVVPSLFTGNWEYWIYTALTFLVISCPCALVLSVPLSFFAGIGAGSKKGILFKGGASLEAMRNVRAVVMDKTGTITKGNFIVQKVVPAAGVDADVLLTLCAGSELSSNHPIAVSIVEAAKAKGLPSVRPSTVQEIAGKGVKAVAEEGEVLCGNRSLMEMFGVSLDEYQNGQFGTEVFVALNGKFLGYILIADTIKEDAAMAIAAIKKMGIITAMLTGDSEDQAKAVAAATGIDDVRAKLLPQDKLTQLGELREKYGDVMFVGDGINDAPVLAGANVGAAMGSGADAAIEAADVVFMTSQVQAIPDSLEISRNTSRIAWQNIVVALAVKALVMVLGLAGFASMWMAVFADTGVSILCVLNSMRLLYGRTSTV